MRHGLLVRKTLFTNSRGKRIEYRSLRFFSMHNKHVVVMRMYITPLDDSARFEFESSVDTEVTNKGYVTEGRKKHVHIYDFEKKGTANYLCLKTLEKETLLVYTSELRIKKGNKVFKPPRRALELYLKKGETIRITKYFTVYTSLDVAPKKIKKKSIEALEKAVKKGFYYLIKDHINSWNKRWMDADIEISADHDIERTLRFNIYHLLIAGNENNDNVSIGAKTLTGEGYRGHVFWDNEIFILPFFIYTNPNIARNLLMYRYNRLNAARRIANNNGFRGAMFPWESADSGEEVTPSWYKSSDGRIIPVNTGKQEHHINADIPYSIFHYYTATNDLDFLLNYGLEVIFETARFWASRLEYNEKKKRYEIKNIIGPDEFHENVNNNAFTNAMAKWTLNITTELYKVFRRKYSRKIKLLMKIINLKHGEINSWPAMAKKIYIPFSKKSGLIEEFDGFFKLKKYPLPERDNNYIPLNPQKISHEKFNNTQFVKQADVVILLYLLSDTHPSFEMKSKNYTFYKNRTLHESSLSASIHSILASELSKSNEAYKYFLASLYTDLKDIYGNTVNGIHGAAAGGTWQAVINGFAGARIIKGILSLKPNLPFAWNRIKFRLKWKGYDLDIEIADDKITIWYKSKKRNDWIFIRAYDLLHKIRANRAVTIYRKTGKTTIAPKKEINIS
jgi:kojibiose phosphorylase